MKYKFIIWNSNITLVKVKFYNRKGLIFIKVIQIQHLLKLNLAFIYPFTQLRSNSNTTLVKVKFLGTTAGNVTLQYSNTTLVKVK